MAIRVNKAGEIRTDYHIIYDRLLPIIAKLDGEQYVKLEAKGFMDLHVNRLNADYVAGKLARGTRWNYYSLAHYYNQNGDMVPDPDMVVRVDPEMKMAEVWSYQDSFRYDQVYIEQEGKVMVYPKLKKDLNHFMKQWLRNIKQQGFLR